MYIMPEGQTNKDRNGGSWSNQDHEPTADFYARQNNNRQFDGKDRSLIVNTTSLGLSSPWLEYLSQKTQGYYNQIDKESIENSQEDQSNENLNKKFDEFSTKKIGRNEPCPCNSGKKYKHCHGAL